MTEKPGVSHEIPPNAAPAASVAAVKQRIENLGVEYNAAVASAGLSRMTGHRLQKGTGSTGSLRILEEWVVKQESKNPPPTRAQAKVTRANEWSALGAELAELDPERFATMLDGLRDLVKAKRLEGAAILKMFRANPDRDD